MATTHSPATGASRQVGKLTVTTTAEGVVFRRVFDAPRRLVWEAMSKPEHYPHWWGPASQEMISCALDFRPGGSWRFVTRGEDGEEHGFRGEIREAVPLERLVQTFEYEGAPGTVLLDAMSFVEEEGRTILTVTSTLEAGSPEAVQAMADAGMEGGAAETYDRLEAYARTLA